MHSPRERVEEMYPGFWKTMEAYIAPMERLDLAMRDSTYFMRRDDSLVFCEGYCHPEGGLYGKIIYYPQENGGVAIHGRPYECLTKKLVDDEMVYISHPAQIARQCELDPSLDKERPPYAEYELEFPLGQFIGYFDCRKSLHKAVECYPAIERSVRQVSEVLDIPIERLGVTGSLAYGMYDPHDEDFDVVFFGTVEENRHVIQKIYTLTRDPARQVIEYNKLWPMRFHHRGVLVCPFFVYSDWNEVPLKEFTVEVLREKVHATGRVCEDTHAIYMPAILQLDNITIDRQKCSPLPLIIYDGALRGDFRNGDELRCSGMLVRITQGREEFDALLVNLYNQLEKTNFPG
jgi:predicted nucleotidyltransferase